MVADVTDDFARARQQPGIIQQRLAHVDAKESELASFPQQPGCLCQRANGNGAVIGRHAANLAAGHKNCSCPQFSGADSSDQPGRTSANH